MGGLAEKDDVFEQFVRQCGKDILRFCRMTAGNVEDGDELYQDTMLKLLEKGKSLDFKQNTKSYALSVAIFLWKNKCRKRGARERLAPSYSMEALADTGREPPDEAKNAVPEQLVIQRDEESIVRRMVAELPEKYRQPIYLYYAADMQIGEISKCLRLSEGTVKSRMRKAKSMLKEKLEAIGYDR